jgi:SAM-dependent methyltransferase
MVSGSADSSERARRRALLFGSVAESYERFRHGYPDAVAELVLAYADVEVRRAVEVGAGTGKATRLFASHGVAVTALEPDPEMCAILRRETSAMPVTPVLSTYEDYVPGPGFDLLYAAAAWHWTEPGSRWVRAARLVDPGGTVAFFGSPMRVADDDLRQAVDEARSLFVPDDEVTPRGKRTDQPDWPAGELVESGLFVDVEQHVIDRHVLVDSEEFIGYLSTVSAYLQLPPPEHREVLRRIANVLPAELRLDASVRLAVARRARSDSR